MRDRYHERVEDGRDPLTGREPVARMRDICGCDWGLLRVCDVQADMVALVRRQMEMIRQGDNRAAAEHLVNNLLQALSVMGRNEEE